MIAGNINIITSNSFLTFKNLLKLIYQYKDYLGNVRLSYSDADKNGVISNTEDFKDDFQTQKGWTPDANSGSNLSYEAFSGNYAAKIVNNRRAEMYVDCDYVMNINNTAPTSYTYSVRVKGAPMASGGAYPIAELFLFMKTATETTYFTQVDSRTAVTTAGVTTISGTFIVPADIKRLNLRIDNNGGGTIWYDDATLRRTNAAPSEIVEESNYYPFGMKQEGYNNIVDATRNLPAQRYK